MRSTAEAKRCACVCVSVGALHMYSMNQYLTAAIQLKIAHILSNTDREINYAFFRLCRCCWPVMVVRFAFSQWEIYSTYLPIQYARGCLIVILNFAYFLLVVFGAVLCIQMF